MNSTVHEPEGNNLWYEEPSTDLCFLDELDAVPADSMGGQVYHRTPFKPSWADWMSGRERQSGCLTQQCGDVEQKVNQLRSMLEERKKEPVANYVETVLPQRLAQGMRPEQAFRAGALHSRAAVWERYLQLGSVPGEQQLRASTMLRKGVALEWCHPLDAHKQLEPRHKARTAGVCAQLQEAGFSREAARSILSADSPASVVLGNRFANEEHRNFAREQIRTNVARGAVVEWKWKGLRPWIVLPLSVCVNSAGKMRLIVDGRYVNLFLRRMLFKYETASDAARMLRDMQWIWTLDFMSGYHHLLLRPEDWTYVGLQLDGQLYVHAALPFGLSQAPAVFTSITQLGYSVLQQAGGSLTGMVDDSLGAAKGLSHAARDMATQVVVLGALGWTLSSKKCMMRPGRVAEYLGFRFDMEARMMFVPEAKLNRLLAGLRDLKQSWSRCKQQSMAGMLASMGLAMPFSPMMVRALRYEAEKVEEEPVLGMELTSFLETNMIELNGRPWDAAIRAAVILVVDTSESATGAYIQGMSWSAIINFDADDLARMAAGNYSSTEREVVGILRALREVLRSRVLQQTGYGAIQVICDNKGAVSALQHLRGGYSVFPTVAKVHMLAKEEGIVLTFAWEPRDTDRVQRADELSKDSDDTDWRLSRAALTQQVMGKEAEWVAWGCWPPHCDLFASRLAHQVPWYIAKVWDGQSVGQDAMAQRWSMWPSGSEQLEGSKPVMFAFPPMHLLQQTLMKIKIEEPTIWLVCTRYMREIDQRYLSGLPVRCQFPLKCRAEAQLVKPTRSNPAWKARQLWYTPLQVVLISWERQL